MKMNWMSLFVLVVLSVFISVFLSSAIVAAEEQASIQTPNNLLEIQEAIGAVRAELTADDLSALTGGLFKTALGNSEYHQFVRFKAEEGEETINSGAVVFATNSQNVTGDYLFFGANTTILEYALVFDDGISSKISAGSAEDFVGKKLNILGSTYTIQSAAVDGEEVTISLAQDNTTLQFSDSSFADADFSNHPLVNNQEIVDGKVKIEGFRDGDVLTINSLRYRITPSSDVYVVPGHGIKEYLSQPEAFLTDNWDIQYDGLTDTGVSIVRFNSKGDNAYDLQFMNTEGLEYDVPFVDNSGDSLSQAFKMGDDDNDLVVFEGKLAEDSVDGRRFTTNHPGFDTCGNFFPIDDQDWFILTSSNGITHILRYEHIDVINKTLKFTDDAGPEYSFNYTTENLPNECILGKTNIRFGNTSFTTYISNGNQGAGDAGIGKYPLIVDMNEDGKIDFKQVPIRVQGGGLLRLWNVDNLASHFNYPSNNEQEDIEKYLNLSAVHNGGSNHFGETYLRANTDSHGQFDASIITVADASEMSGQKPSFDGNGVLDTGKDEIINITISGVAGNKVNLNVSSPQKVYDPPRYPLQVTLLELFPFFNESLIQGMSTYGLFFEQTDESSTNDANDLTIEYPLSQRGGNVNIVMNDTLINNICIIAFEENEYVSPCESLNLSEYSDHPVTGMTITVEGYGMIDFGNSSLNLTDSDPDLYLNILPNNITLQSTVLNVPATLTLYDLSFVNPEILVNGQPCSSNECVILNYTNGTLVFSVPHFSSYSAGEKQPAPPAQSTSSIGGGGGGGGGSRKNTQVPQQTNQQVQSTTPVVSVPVSVSPSALQEQISESPAETASQEESLGLNQEADAGLSGVTGAVTADVSASNKSAKIKSIVSLFIGVALLYGFFKLKERRSDQINKHNKELKKE
ncbi:MAG: hypothetical protein Q7R76_00700 [Candidatus Woesearchaeota archaeon]|nr:hypothetical protein [Candidatus Woesearchaeota archaeon]